VLRISNLLLSALYALCLFSVQPTTDNGPHLARIFHELLSRDRETGNPLAGLSGAERARRGWTCHLATRPAVPRDWSRGVPERYVAGADTRGRQEGRPYPWSQQVIHEISGLVAKHGAHIVEGGTNGSGEIIAMVGQDTIAVTIGNEPRVTLRSPFQVFDNFVHKRHGVYGL
jgi:hypothetical protein